MSQLQESTKCPTKTLYCVPNVKFYVGFPVQTALLNLVLWFRSFCIVLHTDSFYCGNCQYSEKLLRERGGSNTWVRQSLMTLLYDEAAESFSHSYNTQASLRKKTPLWPASTLYKQNTASVQTGFLFLFFQLKFTPLTKQAVHTFHNHRQAGSVAESSWEHI